MDSLDDPILSSILTSLAANLARSGNLPSQRRSSIAPSPLSNDGPVTNGAGASEAIAVAKGQSGEATLSSGISRVAHGDVQDSIKDMQVHTAKSDDRVPQLKGKGKGKGRAGEQEEGQAMLKDVGDGNEVPVRGWSDARDVLKHRLAVLNATLAEKNTSTSLSTADLEMADVKHKLADALSTLQGGAKSLHMPGKEYQQLLFRAVSLMVASPRVDSQALHYLVQLPMASLTPLAVSAGTSAWTWLIRQHPEARNALVAEVAAGWVNSIRAKKGLFNPVLDYADPYTRPIEYSPSEPILLDRDIQKARRILRPHMDVLKFIADQVQGSKYRGVGLMGSVFRMLMATFSACEKLSTHPIARETRFALVQLGLQILANGKLESLAEIRLREKVYECAGHWFSVRPQWSHSTEFQQSAAEIRLLQDVQALFKADRVRCEGDNTTSAFTSRAPILRVRTRESGGRGLTLQEFSELHGARVRLMMLLLENEVSRLTVWKNPLNENERGGATVGAVERAVKSREWPTLIKQAWRFNPAIAVHMGERFKNAAVQAELTRLVKLEPQRVLGVPEAVRYLIGDHVDPSARAALKWLAIWSPVPPVTALTYFEPRYGNHPLILQYAMRVLEQHPVGLVFFFVPQIVQALRTDELGYVEQFIFETSKISQLFCHQIIWNMKANTYKDDNAEMPDPMKPLLDSMIDRIVTSLSGKAKAFYELEFGFFDEVTSISGKLKPYIKKEKSEKKAKIDEEMAKIKLEVGVYLPSNPDGTVVDIKRDSGRPLQSHAKAPFMATFKVRRERVEVDDGTGTGATKAATEGSETAAQAAPASSAEAKGAAAAGLEEGEEVKKEYDVWQSAIFKVGDDCRQDVLALQIIAMFKNAFWSVGLDLYLFPYRVTATAPGCGVIDVVPNSTSRDEMGRNHVNDLNLYCIQKYGGEETAAYQKARLNFIRSMAAYSVACFILQIKDRHNGNIMIDDDGHIIHIDFGFLFDIGPGGIKFEPNSFKLNREMVALMGGSDSQGFKLFNELTVKAFLAIRPYADQLVDTVHLMLGTGLPSFKGEPTIQRLRDRFMLHLNERRAAEYMMGVINNAHENLRSGLYDRFQHFQNGIPY